MKHPLFFVSLLLLLVSCKSNSSLTHLHSDHDANWEGEQSYQVLVTANFLNPGLRQYYETEMTRALQKEKVGAVASFTVYPNLSTLNTKFIQDMMRSRPNVALLFSEANTVNRSQQSSGQKADSIFSKLRGGDTIDWDNRFSVIIQNSLFVGGQESAVWWNRTKLVAVESDGREAIKDLVQIEVKEMKKSGAISRLK
ncbi:hypothetical protein N9Q19_00770 [Puniceicoccaceae bacterium]|nr:hypothetical protein [Puniceicoccaceae bacterium]